MTPLLYGKITSKHVDIIVYYSWDWKPKNSEQFGNIVFINLISEIIVDASCSSTGPLTQCKDAMSTCSLVTVTTYQCTCNNGYYNKAGICTNSIYIYPSIWYSSLFVL